MTKRLRKVLVIFNIVAKFILFLQFDKDIIVWCETDF